MRAAYKNLLLTYILALFALIFSLTGCANNDAFTYAPGYVQCSVGGNTNCACRFNPTPTITVCN